MLGHYVDCSKILCKFDVGKEREIYRECATPVSRHHFKFPCTGTAKISFILYKVKQKM